MKETIKILFCLAILACNTQREGKPDVRDSTKNQRVLSGGIGDSNLVYIEDAKFKVYLKMCASPVLYYNKPLHSYMLNDTLLYGTLDLELSSCDTVMGGLAVHFTFRQGDKKFLISAVNLPAIKEYVSGVFYKGKALDKYSYIKDNIYYDEPFKIDTALAINFYNSNKNINPWFRKQMHDRLITK